MVEERPRPPACRVRAASGALAGRPASPWTPAVSRGGRRVRGVVLIAFVVALLVISTFALWALQLTSTGASAALAHFQSTGAFYAAESGLEMALVEINGNQTTYVPRRDFDSDGTIGTISNNGNAADDPALATGSFSVSVDGTFYTATGTWQGYRRVLLMDAQ